MQAFRRTGEAGLRAARRRRARGRGGLPRRRRARRRFLVASCWGDGRVVRMTLDAAGRPSSPVIAAAAVDPYGARCRLRAGARPATSTSPPRPARCASRRRRVRAPRARPRARIRRTPEDDGIRRGASVPRARGRLPAGRADRDDRHGATTSCASGATAAAGLRPVQQVALPEGQRAAAHGVAPERPPVRRDRAVVRGVRARTRRSTAPGGSSGGTPLGAGTLPGDSAAELRASRDGEFLYAGVRGSNTIATLPRARRRRRGWLRSPSSTPASTGRGTTSVVRDILLVAGQLSDEVASLTLDTRTGVPGRVRHRADAPSPTCLLPIR